MVICTQKLNDATYISYEERNVSFSTFLLFDSTTYFLLLKRVGLASRNNCKATCKALVTRNKKLDLKNMCFTGCKFQSRYSRVSIIEFGRLIDFFKNTQTRLFNRDQKLAVAALK